MNPRTAPWWLRLVGWCVPRLRRESWVREWHAELVALERRAGERDAGGVVRARAVLVCFFSALEDSVGMWGRSAGGGAGLTDLRLAFRNLVRSPTFAFVAILTLGLGIGANAAIYSVVRSVLIRPLPYEDPAMLVDVRLSFRNLETGSDNDIPASEPEFMELADTRVGLRIAGYWTSDVNLGGGGAPERAPVAYVSADFFELLGVAPLLGRSFLSGEDLPGNDGVALLSHGLWVRAFGADPAAIGSMITLNGSPATVVGILPDGFVFPAGDADVIRPNVIDPAAPGGRSSHYFSMIGRVEPGRDIEAVQARVTDLADHWSREYPGRHGISPGHPITLVPLRDALLGDTKSSLLLLQGVVALVLLIASANVASLMLVRIEHRQSETGVRLALGAGLRGVVAPFLAESLIVAVTGAGFGLALASGAVRVVDIWGPAELTRLGGIGIDATVLAFTALVTAGSAVLFGLLPSLSATRSDVIGRLRDGARGVMTARPRAALRQGMIVAEVALAVMVVIGAGLLIKSFVRLRSVEPGIDPSGVVTMDFSLTAADYPSTIDLAAFHNALDERLRGVPGLVAAGAIRSLPFMRSPGVESMKPVGRPTADDDFWNAQYQVVSPGVLDALAIPLLAGRGLERSDRDGTPAVALVNQAMADAFWPGESPLGARVKFGHPEGTQPVLTIVGVVGNVRQAGYRGEIFPQILVPRSQAGAIYEGLATRFATLVIRSDLAAPVAVAAARQALRDLDPRLPVANVRTMSDVMAGSVTDERFLAGLVGAFSMLALTLGAVGVGGLVAYTVERRTPEFGLRLALGARPGGILARVVTRALGLTGTGALVGTVLSLGSARVFEQYLFGVSSTDPLIFAAAPLALVSAALAAAWLPAARAARIPPTQAMRGR